MRITHFYKAGSKAAHDMNLCLALGDIYDAYNSPSINKVRAFNSIRDEYCYNDTNVLGIPCKTLLVPAFLGKLNNTMYVRYIAGTFNVCAASSNFFSTIALFEDIETNKRYLIKETYANTYMCEVE